MAEADVRLTTVSRDGAPLSGVIPAGAMSKADGKSAIAGKWKIAGVENPVQLTISGSSVTSVEAPFGNQKFMAEVDESCDAFGLHVTMGGFPMKAWLNKDGGSPVLVFSNNGKW
eukprot:CAMPEP_0178423224 /NCGR_PEP_ID=MMETSP0689_2-20121128/27578_1 /TAXON_ID=160604 /ORGANISM="Amphidinium massartii, Strain CS-259" /LENGTH=113 /DNA_ID=CAMNT_0020044811 /DNA_START=63 /DNA_END=401 /DNA_ORIENTATION=-